jgi:hypothetical protein
MSTPILGACSEARRLVAPYMERMADKFDIYDRAVLDRHEREGPHSGPTLGSMIADADHAEGDFMGRTGVLLCCAASL